MDNSFNRPLLTIKNLLEYEFGLGIFDHILNDDFTDNGRVHNWRNYVPCEFKDTWQSLGEDVRLAIYYMAETQSDLEEWD